MSEIARHQLLITLVHGTWPRGLFPRLARFRKRVWELIRRKPSGPPPPFWFEDGSLFLARLSNELGGLPHRITPLLWSGANSIFVRDETAHRLAEHLAADHAEHRQATQLVIAHSHGGNIALRALHLLHQADGSRLCDSDGANPLVVTLATPFIEVQHADFGDAPTLVRIAVFMAIWFPSLVLTQAFFPMDEFNKPLLIGGAVSLVFAGLLWWCFFSKRAARRRENNVEILRTVTRLGEIVSAQAQRVLIIRAIDDEASLTLALSTIANFFITRAIRYIRWIVFGPVGALLVSVIVIRYLVSLGQEDSHKQIDWYEDAIQVGFCALILFLFGLLSVARSAHGLELARSPLELQINTQSAPDAKGLSEIVTLVRRTHAKSLRHGIYDHEDCAKTIAAWVQSRPACEVSN